MYRPESPGSIRVPSSRAHLQPRPQPIAKRDIPSVPLDYRGKNPFSLIIYQLAISVFFHFFVLFHLPKRHSVYDFHRKVALPRVIDLPTDEKSDRYFNSDLIEARQSGKYTIRFTREIAKYPSSLRRNIVIFSIVIYKIIYSDNI